MSSLEQVQALHAGSLDAGFVFNFPEADPELDQLVVATQHLVLAAPRHRAVTERSRLGLRGQTDPEFIWFPRR
jgi:hypothetical protein